MAWNVGSALLKSRRLFSDASTKVSAGIEPRSDVRLNGWVQKSQRCGSYVFLHVSDGMSTKQIQIVVPKDVCRAVPVGSAISVRGRWQPSSGPQQDFEVLASSCEVIATDTDPRYSSLSPDHLRKHLHLRARSTAFSALLRLRSKLFFKTHEYFSNRGFVHIDTPMLTYNDCEGAGETFSVATTSCTKDDDFFAKEGVRLSVSGQLHLEAMVSGLSNVYTISNGLRADKQQSRNHLTEFKMIEVEMAFCNDLDQLLTLAEDLLLSSVRYLLNDPEAMKDFQSLGTFSSKDHLAILRSIADTPPFPRVPYAEAFQVLVSKNQNVVTRSFSKQNEAFLVNYYNSPVFITHFPSDQKPFYTLRSLDEKVTESFDLLCPFVGELASGSLRETSADKLRSRSPNIEWYTELRERGKPISGGFGMGFDRLLQLLLGIANIKDTIPFPRWFKHCQC
ncbi:hypothetical protein KIN20_008413 [Parelaphostrongylus tenuis]|uniref:Aminoacyl-transfer RNA synthetases class-II family profile domain-containing protein n=1 Tax=Parelaphostrongylus tenuis TaxID=148309 RepID=A0AAD5MNW3_PARTN|nr:hypothetical protein KIN20_008413 [Parelaphostrongylus tenuis]